MRKGVWLKNLIELTLEAEISFNDAISIISARIKPKPTSIKINGILFQNVDRIMWGIIADIYLNHVYTPSGIELHPHDIIVDVGAHRGAFTSFAASRADTTVISFEPHPENYRALLNLIGQNNLKNVTAHNLAVSSKSGKTHLFLSAKNSRHSLLHDESNIGPGYLGVIEVDTLSLDDCLENLKFVNLLKLDCEGAETEILLKAKEKTLKKIQKVVAEIHDPIHSEKIRNLRERLELFFPQIQIVDQGQYNLSYLYAMKE